MTQGCSLPLPVALGQCLLIAPETNLVPCLIVLYLIFTNIWISQVFFLFLSYFFFFPFLFLLHFHIFPFFFKKMKNSLFYFILRVEYNDIIFPARFSNSHLHPSQHSSNSWEIPCFGPGYFETGDSESSLRPLSSRTTSHTTSQSHHPSPCHPWLGVGLACFIFLSDN